MFPINLYGFYGAGSLGNITDPSAQINSYARVTAITSTTVTVDIQNASLGGFETFGVNNEVMIHVSNSSNADSEYLFRFATARIKKVSLNVLTVDKDLTSIIPANSLSNYNCQLITIAQFKNLTVSNTIAPLAWDEDKKYGGIIAIKCSNKLTLSGGKIDLRNAGNPNRSLSSAELAYSQGDKNLDAGSENSALADKLTINEKDGSAFIITKTFTMNDSARIGNPSTQGIAKCRGDFNSPNKPSGVYNRGGSSILLAAESIDNFNVKCFAKYCSTQIDSSASPRIGSQAACYIATNTVIPCDEGLYAHDVISTPERLQSYTNIKSYGDSSAGAATNITTQLNSYAKVNTISGKRVTCAALNNTGKAKFEKGTMVMLHMKNDSNTSYGGRFFISTIVSVQSNIVTLADAPPSIHTKSGYSKQLITIPQFESFKLTSENKATPKYDNGCGGLFAVAVNGACDLRGGKINVEGKGGGKSYGETGLKYVDNANLKIKLPIGAGHGSVFILAKKLLMNESTRIGATYSGSNENNSRAGYTAGEGDIAGGNGSNGQDDVRGGSQGAHIFIVAGEITGLNYKALSTGGAGGKGLTAAYNGKNGGCGYGGAGGNFKNSGLTAGLGGVQQGGAGVQSPSNSNYYGGGGGSSGFAFVYYINLS